MKFSDQCLQVDEDQRPNRRNGSGLFNLEQEINRSSISATSNVSFNLESHSNVSTSLSNRSQ